MGRVNDTISNVNSAIRNLLLAILVAGAGIGGYKAYDLYNAPRQQLADKQAELDSTASNLKLANDKLAAQQKKVTDLSTELADKTAQVDRVEVSLKLLKVRHRLARVRVVDQQGTASLNPAIPSEGTDNKASHINLLTKIEFTEVDEQGNAIGEPKSFDIVGDMVYVDYLRVTFDDKFIEQSDLDRSTSIVLFQRVFGEHQAPAEGFQLDTVGSRPTAYARGTQMTEFEKKIWTDFWLIANDPQRARDLGINAAHGAAVAMRVQNGKTYELELRSTGEMSFRPIDAAPSIVPPVNSHAT
ncbi:MAG TPA: hypothetical protein VH107_17440 [Lacipirellulaceae bacterium]|nr:hypothetical protein [Lacipirellulaceae bacterium]